MRVGEAFLSIERRRKSSVGRTTVDDALSDRARVLTASCFRRLQTKAQVFSLEKNAAVRSRLTHTLEVALYGQLIARQAVLQLGGAKRLSVEQAVLFTSMVETACLLHDVGNPPFGHLGEFAIQEWFTKKANKLRKAWLLFGVPDDKSRSLLAAYQALVVSRQVVEIQSHIVPEF
jgi:dGTPase